MWDRCCNLFQQVKENPVVAANIGGSLSSTVATIPFYILHYEDILFADMNEYAAQALIGAIGFGIFVIGAIASALTQQAYSRCYAPQNNNEYILVTDTANLPRFV